MTSVSPATIRVLVPSLAIEPRVAVLPNCIGIIAFAAHFQKENVALSEEMVPPLKL
jgi:hypothetical protein